jgi:hypothetical protein
MDLDQVREILRASKVNARLYYNIRIEQTRAELDSYLAGQKESQ